MTPIDPRKRRVVNINDAQFTSNEPDEQGTSYVALNPDMPAFEGFYIYKMAPGSHSTPHRHTGAEEFYVIEGDLTDNDGTTYKTGDIVWLAADTEHTSHSKNGCTVAVFSQRAEVALPKS